MLRAETNAAVTVSVAAGTSVEFALMLRPGSAFVKQGAGTLTAHPYPGYNTGSLTIGEGSVVFSNNVSGSSGGASKNASTTDCLFIMNVATNGAGGSNGGTHVNARFIRNRARYGGAGDQGTYQNCLFQDNVATDYAGALTGNASSYDCVFEGNVATNNTGVALGGTHYRALMTNNVAAYAAVARGATLNDCEIVGNYETGTSLASNGKILNGCNVNRCHIHGNRGNARLFFKGTFTNCLVEESESTDNIGAFREAEIINCTVVDNAGGGIEGGTYKCTLKNAIVHGNTPYDIMGNTTASSSLYGTFSAGSSVTGSGNIVGEDPRFNLGHNPKDAWYALRTRSPARDAGMEVGFTATDTDFAGNLRLNGTVDMGCYEFWPSIKPTMIMLH